MESRSFHTIEGRIGPFIWDLSEEIMLENIKEEVKASLIACDYDGWDASINATAETPPLATDKYPRIMGSFDTAWQQKKSGHSYDSPSGHGLIFGAKTRKPLVCVVKSKLCNYCTYFKKSNPGVEVVPNHDCMRNHTGSSGSMEAAGCLELLIKLFDQYHCVVEKLCCDDDSSVRADCRWSNADYLKNNNTDVLPQVPISKGPRKGQLQDRPDKGKLPAHIPESSYVSDPNHRGKLVTGEMITIDMSRKELKLTMSRVDSTRIGKNFKYMARTLRDVDPKEYCRMAGAVLKHHFDVHSDCGDWCRRKSMTAAELAASDSFYRNMSKDEKLFKLLSKKMERFTTHDRLVDIAHGMDTNANESFNNTVSWFAPKNKVFCGSNSLNNRIGIAIGITSKGFISYFTRLLNKMGIAVTPNVLHFLRLKDRQRQARLDKLKSKVAKRHRNKKKFDKLVADTAIARKERAKRDGTYKRGVALDGDEEVIPGKKK